MSQWIGYRYFILVIFGASYFLGCITQKTMPIAPKLPTTKIQTLEEVVLRDASIDDYSTTELPSFIQHTLGLNEFSKEGGAMVTDMIAIKLLPMVTKNQVKMVDREYIEEVVAELERTAEGLTKMSEVERLKKIGELAGADYLLFGSVTEFNTLNMSITLDKLILEGEEERYSEEYEKFFAEVEAMEGKVAEEIQGMQVGAVFTMGLSGIGGQEAYKQQRELDKLKLKTPSLEEFKSKFRGKQQFVTVANVGITAKLIDVQTGKIAWVFQVSKRDIDLRRGMKVLVSSMLNSLLKNTRNP